MRLHLTLPLGLVICALGLSPAAVFAVSVGDVDDFQGGLDNWEDGIAGGPPTQVADEGPDGAGDFAMLVESTGAGGPNSRMVIFNDSQWTGDWDGITKIRLDVRGSSSNGGPLNVALGIAGPGGFLVGGFNSSDTWLTNSQSVPSDDSWYTLTFDVTADDWGSFGEDADDIDAALADVTHFRVLSNSSFDWRGESADLDMYLDNIAALPEPSTLIALIAGAPLICLCLRRVRRQRMVRN